MFLWPRIAHLGKKSQLKKICDVSDIAGMLCIQPKLKKNDDDDDDVVVLWAFKFLDHMKNQHNWFVKIIGSMTALGLPLESNS